MSIKDITERGEKELEYADTPPSGRGDGNFKFALNSILKNIKDISVRKPFIMVVGSLATQGKSDNDIDIVVRGEDLSRKVKEAIDFRIYRLFTKILECEYDEVKKYVHIHYNNAGSYTSYVPLYELNLVPVEDNKLVEMTKTPFSLRGNIVQKSDDGRRIISGYANVAVVDSDNDFIPTETLKKGIETLLEDESYSNLMLLHKNIQIGKIIKKYKDYQTHVDDKGLFIVAEIRQDLETANEIWNKILEEEFTGFSIGCEVIETHEHCDDTKCVNVLDEINIFEVSICSKPINKESGFVIVSKSETNDVCDSCRIKNKSDVDMAEEENEEIKENQENEEPSEDEQQLEETTMQETLEQLKSRINAIEGLIQDKQEEEDEEEEEEMPDEEEEENMESEETEMQDSPVHDAVGIIADTLNIEASEVWDALDELIPDDYPEPGKYPYPEKSEDKDLPLPESYEKSESEETWQEVIVKSIDSIQTKISEIDDYVGNEKKVEELELAIKSRDDEIAALKKTIENDLDKVKGRIEVIEKSEDNPKSETTKEDNEKKVKVLPKLVKERGQIYRR